MGGVRGYALTTQIVTPHPPTRAGTFSLWEKEGSQLPAFL